MGQLNTPLVNKRADAGVGTTGHAAAGFDGPQAGKTIVLAMARGIFPPAVVGNDEEEVGPCLTHIVGDILAENRLPADDRGHPGAILWRGKGLPEFLITVSTHGTSQIHHQFFKEAQ